MNAAALFVALSALGVDFGWRPGTDGKLEYMIQIEPALIEAMRQGEEIVCDIPPEVRGGTRFRIRLGTESVPRVLAPSEPTSSPAQPPTAARSNDARPTEEQLSLEASQGAVPDDQTRTGPLLSAPPLAGAREVEIGSPAPAGRTTISDDHPAADPPLEPPGSGAFEAAAAPRTDPEAPQGGSFRIGDDETHDGAEGPSRPIGDPASRPLDIPPPPDFGGEFPKPPENSSIDPRPAARIIGGDVPAANEPAGQGAKLVDLPPPPEFGGGPFDSGPEDTQDVPPWPPVETPADDDRARPGDRDAAHPIHRPNDETLKSPFSRSSGPPTNPIPDPDRADSSPRTLDQSQIADVNALDPSHQLKTAAFDERPPVPAAAESPALPQSELSRAPESPRPWTPLLLTSFALFASLGANCYLGWIAFGIYQRYRRLAEQIRPSAA